jgi:hypothetical protein
LAILFPGTIISDLSFKTTADSANTSITAKMFYNSVDNANHNNYYWTSASNPTIPGLLPILPYIMMNIGKFLGLFYSVELYFHCIIINFSTAIMQTQSSITHSLDVYVFL